jgi:hypothetical protein
VTQQTSEAFGRWADEVAALGGSEPLTRFRDLKSGTLDLQGADDDTRRRLLDGEPVRVSRLFPHDPIRTAAARSAHRLVERLTALRAGHGLAAGYLVTGLATWNDRMSARRPMAPVLLRRLVATPTGIGDDDVLLHVVGEPELNGLLLEAMADQLGLRLTPQDLLDASGELRYPVVVEKLREQAPPHIIDGFTIHHRAVVGVMSAVPQTQAAELRAMAATFARTPLVALAAGAEPEPVTAADATPAHPGRDVPPLDLDSVQNDVRLAVRAGRSVAVEAPVGTGAVQLTAALCADAVQRGATVLVVAEAEPRLQAVARRLAEIGLAAATLDLSDGLISAAAVARDSLVTLEAASPRGERDTGGSPTPEPPHPHPAAGDHALLSSYHDALHRVRSPWGMSAYDAITAATAAGAGHRVPVRLDADDLERLDAATLSSLRHGVAEFVDLDGLRVGPAATGWFGARPAGQQDAEQAIELVTLLHDQLTPSARELAARAAAEVGMPAPAGPEQARELASLLESVAQVQRTLHSEVWSSPVEKLAAATADRRARKQMGALPPRRERRALRAQAAALVRDPAVADDPAAVARTLTAAAQTEHEWVQRCRDGRRPRLGDTSTPAVEAVRRWHDAADRLRALHPDALPPALDFAGTQARLGQLVAEAGWVRRLPTLTATATALAEAGLGPFVAWLRGRAESGERVDGRAAAAALDGCVAASIAEQILQTDPVLAQADGPALRAAAERWRLADAAEVVASAEHARREWLHRVRRAATERPVHLRALRDSAAGREPRTVRGLLAEAGETLRTARPLWLAGPLTAADALPPRSTFDLLVVLDAHGVSLAHCIGVLARARQVAVLGDPQLPPPLAVPVSIEAPDPRAAAPLPGTSVETPSLLAVLGNQLEQHRLTVRYGCHDERLHALVPPPRGRRPLAVPPATATASPVRFVHVPQQAGSRDQEESVSGEVDQVVALVREHVEQRPGRSLAVVALGAVHAHAVRAGLARACLGSPALAEALGPDAEEPFVLRAVDDLHSERRDDVILTVGFGRTVDGRLLYRYGPLNRPGGLRWLAAAVSTARDHLTVVSSIRADELEPRRLAADGVRGLRDMLAVAEGVWADQAGVEGEPGPADAADAADAVDAADGRQAPDPVLAEIHDRLQAAGLPVALGGGIGELEVPLVLGHRGRGEAVSAGRGLVAVETDGEPFRSLRSVRDRERLRPEQLMRAGWATVRLCSVAWARDPDGEVEHVRAVLQRAQHEADAWDAARSMPALQQPDTQPPSASSAAAAPPREQAPRPPVPAGRLVDGYPPRDLLSLAEWVDAVEPEADEQQQVATLAREMGLSHPEDRAAAHLLEAVRAVAVLRGARRPAVPLSATNGPDAPPLEPADVEGADAEERRRERAAETDAHDAWLAEQRPPHHE